MLDERDIIEDVGGVHMFEIKKGWPLSEAEELVLIGLFDQPEVFEQEGWEKTRNLTDQLKELLHTGDLSKKMGQITTVFTLGLAPAKRILFVGLGKKKELTTETLKETFGKAFQTAQKMRIGSISVAIDSFVSEKHSVSEVGQLLGEAFALSLYQFPGYKKKSNLPEVNIENVRIYTGTEGEELEDSLRYGYIYGKATNSARTLVNTPHNLLTATDLAEYAKELADKYGFETEILEKEDMEKLGMGALLAVNQGSDEPPKLIVLKYQGKKEWKDVIGLVGKGITYDTGGYSIKTKTGMVGMKTDMGGAASVLGAMEIIGELKPEQNVIAVIPATDNMINGRAFKPDDVITSLSGKTIEVTNTDAEGRLVLADGITYAKQLGANVLIDVATLTGGVITALGVDKTGAMTNSEELFEQFLEASLETGEMIWRLPITEKDREKVRSSKIADLDNSPSREGHAIMGGAFIGEFVEDTPWVHLDIAGTSVTKSTSSLGPSGATGVMVRTLAAFVEGFEPIK